TGDKVRPRHRRTEPRADPAAAGAAGAVGRSVVECVGPGGRRGVLLRPLPPRLRPPAPPAGSSPDLAGGRGRRGRPRRLADDPLPARRARSGRRRDDVAVSRPPDRARGYRAAHGGGLLRRHGSGAAPRHRRRAPDAGTRRATDGEESAVSGQVSVDQPAPRHAARTWPCPVCGERRGDEPAFAGWVRACVSCGFMWTVGVETVASQADLYDEDYFLWQSYHD